MRETQDYSAMPILADALEDAEYPDAKFLEELRGPLTHNQAERAVAVILSDETASAVAWMDGFGEECGSGGGGDEQDEQSMTYPLLMDTARNYIKTGDYLTQYGMSWQDALDGHTEEFWTNYELVTGSKVDNHDGHFFSCTC